MYIKFHEINVILMRIMFLLYDTQDQAYWYVFRLLVDKNQCDNKEEVIYFMAFKVIKIF